MSKTIEITNNIFSRLEEHTKGFNDTPSNVIERLLIAFESDTIKTSKTKKDRTKYIFEQKVYGKGRLVLAVIKSYVNSNSNLTYDNLQKVFPKELQRYGIGVLNTLNYVQEEYISKNKKLRHYIKPEEQIKLKDKIIVVSREWGAGEKDNISGFLEHAKDLGFNITTEELKC